MPYVWGVSQRAPSCEHVLPRRHEPIMLGWAAPAPFRPLPLGGPLPSPSSFMDHALSGHVFSCRVPLPGALAMWALPLIPPCSAAGDTRALLAAREPPTPASRRLAALGASVGLSGSAARSPALGGGSRRRGTGRTSSRRS
eukprot:5440092-Prymnesium_polylepis.1